jgi:hypothetical protein
MLRWIRLESYQAPAVISWFCQRSDKKSSQAKREEYLIADKSLHDFMIELACETKRFKKGAEEIFASQSVCIDSVKLKINIVENAVKRLLNRPLCVFTIFKRNFQNIYNFWKKALQKTKDVFLCEEYELSIAKRMIVNYPSENYE